MIFGCKVTNSEVIATTKNYKEQNSLICGKT